MNNEFDNLPTYKLDGPDGSYQQGKKHRQNIQDKIKAEFEREFRKTKELLAGRTVSLYVRGSELWVSFSIKIDYDDSLMPKSKQFRKSLKSLTGVSYPPTKAGLDAALEIVLELNSRLETGNFSWSQYPNWLPEELKPKPNKVEAKTVGELVDEFKDWFFKTRKFKEGTESRLWQKSYYIYFKRLGLENQLSDRAIIDAILTTESHSRNRLGCVTAIQLFCKYLNYKFDFTEYKAKNIKPKRPKKDISDDEIELGYQSIISSSDKKKAGRKPYVKLHSWLYGMIATYGLRPHECFQILNLHQEYREEKSGYLIPAFTSEKNTQRVIVVTGKTGMRVCPLPMPFDWIEKFSLLNLPTFPDWYYQEKDEEKKADHRDNQVDTLQTFLRRTIKLSFTPYNLRHAYAIRCRNAGMNPLDVKDFMGHSLEMHEKVYNSSISAKTLINNAKRYLGQAETESKKEDELKAIIADQQKQIHELVKTIESLMNLIDNPE
jgi:integrase